MVMDVKNFSVFKRLNQFKDSNLIARSPLIDNAVNTVRTLISSAKTPTYR
jgi:hypothetical protein